MAKFNSLFFLNAYEDNQSSNNPSKNNFRWERALHSMPVNNPSSLSFSLAPGETRSLFNGSRTLNQDNTTEYSIAPVFGKQGTYQLSWSSGTQPNFRTPRVSGADATTQVTVTINGPVATFSAPAVAASFSGQVAGMTTNVVITANTAGAAGNSISLTGDGTSSINTLISNWNTGHPSNTIVLSSGDGTQIPSNSAVIALSGGITGFNLISGGVVAGDFVRIGSNFNQLNQGEWQIISLSPTSFSVSNLVAVAEGPITLGSGFASQIDIYSALGVQVGDTLQISGGFSPVTQGSYSITAVADQWVQFFSAAVLPTEGPILTESINVYFNAQRLVYLEADQHVAMTLNGVAGNEINPLLDCTGKGKPSAFLRTSVIYSMSVTNVSENTANLFLATVE